MTDLEKFIELYRSFDIECKVNTDEDGTHEIILCGSKYTTQEQLKEAGTFSDKLNGHTDFFSTVFFDKEGKFIIQGFWE